MNTTLEPPAAEEAEEDEESTSIECASCGGTIDDPESGDAYWHEDYDGDVCADCYDAKTHTCQLCGDTDVMPSALSGFIVVKRELAPPSRPPGIFRILNQPFLSIPLIGSSHMHATDVCWIDRLPKRDCDFDVSGHICKTCAPRYERIWKKHFQYEPKQSRGWWSAYHWHIEKRRTRKALMAHPDILRDLETPHFWNPSDHHRVSDIRRLEEIYSIRIRARTWHEWLVFRHKGVSIYGCYSPRCDLDSWLLLTPDPRYRCLSHRAEVPHLVLVASCLPTYPETPPKPGETYYFESHYEKLVNSKKAIIDAIDHGLLTQNGAFDREGKPIICS